MEAPPEQVAGPATGEAVVSARQPSEEFLALRLRHAVADAVWSLFTDGLLASDPRTIAAAARSAGIAPSDLRAARDRKEAGVRPRLAPAGLTPLKPEPPAPTVADMRPSNRERYAVVNPAPGLRRCCRCREVKPVAEFNVRNRKTGGRVAMCRPCAKDYQRERRLSVKKIALMNAVGLTFVIGEADEVDGLACTDCGCPIRVGEEVSGITALRHTSCPEPPPRWPQIHRVLVTAR